MTLMSRHLAALTAAIVLATPVVAATPREMLIQASFQTTDKAAALALVTQAIAAAEAQLAANPNDREAQFQRIIGIGNRAKLTRSPVDAKSARHLLEAYGAANPRDPEGQLAIASWHLDTIDAGFLATTLLGAKRDLGLAALDRAVLLGQGRAFFAGFAALMRIRHDPRDLARARALAETAAAAPTPTPLDRLAKRDALALLIPLRAGDGKAAAALARKLLPMGRIG